MRISPTVQMAAATSCESKRTSAYSDDLRWRIVWQSEALGLNGRQIATNLCVHESTVWRVIEYDEENGKGNGNNQ